MNNLFPLFIVIFFMLFLFFVLKYVLMRKFPIFRDYFSLFKMGFVSFFTVFLITLVSWGVVVYSWILISGLINVHASFFEMMFIDSAVALIIFLIAIPGGVGFMELSNSYLYSNVLSVEISKGVLFALLVRLYTIYILIIGGIHIFISILFRRNGTKKILKDNLILKK